MRNGTAHSHCGDGDSRLAPEPKESLLNFPNRLFHTAVGANKKAPLEPCGKAVKRDMYFVPGLRPDSRKSGAEEIWRCRITTAESGLPAGR